MWSECILSEWICHAYLVEATRLLEEREPRVGFILTYNGAFGRAMNKDGHVRIRNAKKGNRKAKSQVTKGVVPTLVKQASFSQHGTHDELPERLICAEC
jgi:hypothetical protein